MDFSYQLVNKEKIYDIKRKVQVYPRANHRHDYLLLRGTLNESLNSYTLMMKLKDYAKGTLVEDSINYTVAVQGKNPKYSDIVIKPDSVFYPSHNHLIQSSFSYKKGDTLGLGSKWYKIEGISPDFKKIEFIEVSSGSKPKKGIQFRKKVEDHLIKGLDGIEKKLFSEMDNKEVMLLEFWGTWCGYCKELTPKLVDMHKAYNDKVSFVSIAYDENVNEVKSYIKKNDIEWFQGFVDRKNEKNTIVDTWKINSFPTFVLIDNNQQILYLGSGGLVLEEMNQIIKNKLFKH